MGREDGVFEDMYEVIGILMGRFMKIHADSDSGELARTQLGALGILSLHDGLPVSELAKRLRISKPQATVLVRRLEELGLVRREPGAEDARMSRLWFTDKGRAALDANMDRMRKGMSAKLSSLGAAERDELKRSLESVARILSKIDA